MLFFYNSFVNMYNNQFLILLDTKNCENINCDKVIK